MSRSFRFPSDQVLKIGPEIADALDKAHRSGIVHRVLKPANISSPNPAPSFSTLALPGRPLRWPLSPRSPPPVRCNLPSPREGTIVGPFQYMSPEQLEGKELDARSDICSLGAALYEMLAGQRPFEGKSQLSIANAILEKEPAPISTVRSLTPPALDHAIGRCLAKDPEVLLHLDA